jgi:TonB family protein
MIGRLWKIPLAGALLAQAAFVFSNELTYEQAFAREVIEFVNLNRLSIARLNRDVHADCFILVTIAATILADGSLKDVSIVKSSSVPVVDRYYRYVVEQAAPFPPLADHYDPVPAEVTVTREFKLDVRLWSDGIYSERECEKLESSTSLRD